MLARRKYLAVAVALIAVATVVTFWSAFSVRAEESEDMPAWLSDATLKVVAAHRGGGDSSVGGDAAAPDPVDVKWTLTTAAAYRASLPDAQEWTTGKADTPVYVVLVDGEFAALHSRADSPVPTGCQLLLVFGAESQELSVVGVLKTPVSESTLGVLHDASLVSATPE